MAAPASVVFALAAWPPAQFDPGDKLPALRSSAGTFSDDSGWGQPSPDRREKFGKFEGRGFVDTVGEAEVTTSGGRGGVEPLDGCRWGDGIVVGGDEEGAHGAFREPTEWVQAARLNAD